MRYFFCLLFLLPMACFAQSLVQGTVVDSLSGKPIPDASVFLNNATYGTKANASGGFKLIRVANGHYDLIVTVVGYETYRLPITVKGHLTLPAIKLLQRTNSLAMVRIDTDPKRERKLRIFKDYFLGREFGRQCTIVNPNVLELRFSEHEEVLSAHSEDFLEIVNDALGYRLKYLVDRFVLDNRVHRVGYEGTVFFEELTGTVTDMDRWTTNRRKAYFGSPRHFLRELLGNSSKRDFMVRTFCLKWVDDHSLKVPQPGDRDWDYAFKYDTLKVTSFIHRTEKRDIFAISYPAELDVFYYPPDVSHKLVGGGREKGNRGQIARILFIEPNLFFDTNGTILNPEDAVFNFKWGADRVGELLPVDYWPEDPPQKTLE